MEKIASTVDGNILRPNYVQRRCVTQMANVPQLVLPPSTLVTLFPNCVKLDYQIAELTATNYSKTPIYRAPIYRKPRFTATKNVPPILRNFSITPVSKHEILCK